MSLNRQLVQNSLYLYYDQHPHHLEIVDHLNSGRALVIRGESGDVEKEVVLPSLRQIDWCVVNHTKTHKVVYMKDNQPFEVNAEYKAQLKAYSKQLFDPFRRGDESVFINSVETSLCQLNFFRWAIPNKVLDYTMEHSADIEQEMTLKIGCRKNAAKPHAKQELNKTNVFRCIKYETPTVAEFQTTPVVRPFSFLE